MDENVSKKISKELECPVCLLVPRCQPVYQCSRGHLVCGECQPQLARCPICSAKFHRPEVTRNFLAESLLELVQRCCRYEVFGCSFSTKSCSEPTEHESTCKLKPVLPEPPPQTWSQIVWSLFNIAINILAVNPFPPPPPPPPNLLVGLKVFILSLIILLLSTSFLVSVAPPRVSCPNS